MNAVPDSIIVNSCQFTPVYLIQDPGAPQGQSYFLAQSTVEESKPISDNLKSFYESSGNLDNSFVNVNSSNKPRILKKQDSGIVGNNLKLASFLLPKTESTNKQQYIVNSVVLKPNVTLSTTTHTSNTVNNTVNNNTVSTTSTINTVPRLNIDSKIVKLKDTTFNGTTLKTIDGRRYNRVEKASPKITKPKEIPPILQTPAASKHTSVQLLKLGETYHSLNQLSDEQMKMVTQALKIFSNPEKIAPEPAYDPVTNTQFIYKVVSPKDLTVVGKNKIFTKEKKPHNETNNEAVIKADLKKDHIMKSEIRREITKELLKKESFVKDIKKDSFLKDVMKKENLKDEVKKDMNVKKNEAKLLKLRIQREVEEDKEMADALAETEDQASPPKVTRSGRKVKLPKMSLPQGIPQKPKKKKNGAQNKNYVSCFQCAMEFPSLYLLQKHYETHPTHIPVKMHSDLFHCLLAIVKSGTDSDRTNIFIQQLEQLIVKLRSLLPCVLTTPREEGKACTISEHVGRLLGVSPGKYHLDMEALSCVKNKDGHCNHRPPSPKDAKQDGSEAQSWITMNNEVILAKAEMETEDCARINSVEKWPTVNKRVWKQKQQKTQENAKRMRLASENCDTLIELEMEDLVILDKNNGCLEEQSAIITQGAEQKADDTILVKIEPDDDEVEIEDCARINSVEKWPTVNRKVWKQKQQKTQENAKRMGLASENCDTLIELGMEDFVILDENNGCLEEQSAIITQGAEQKADNTIVVKNEPDDTNQQEVCANIVEEPTNICNLEQTDAEILLDTDTVQEDTVVEDRPMKNNHAQFHSTHFDIRSSPIKPTSTIFRKFQINPELLAKYEAQIIRSIETVDKDHDRDKNIPCPTVEEVLQTNENVMRTNADLLHPNENVLQTSADILNSEDNVLQMSADILSNEQNILHNSEDLLYTNKRLLRQNSNVLHIEENALHTSPDILCVNENVLQTSQEVLQNTENVLSSADVLPTNEEVRDALVNDDTLQEIFRDEDISADKESFILDRDLKDWILNRSNDDKSEDGFSRSNTLIQPALLHVKDDEIKQQLNIGQKEDSPTSDNHDDSSVLNFLDTIGADCLSYPGTEIRTNCGDFQIDLFSFHSS